MSIVENKRVVESFYEASGNGDIVTLRSLVGDDLKWTSIGTTPFSGTIVGRETVLTLMMNVVFELFTNGIKPTVHRLIAEGDSVVGQVTAEAETKNGQAYHQCYCHVFNLRDGKIVEVTEYLDTALCNAVLAGIRR
jgi:uncharacterized protein